MSTEWTKYEVAEATGLAPSSVTRWARRHDVPVIRMGPSASGRWIAYYRPADVRAARDAQPGSGNRTPRNRTEGNRS